MKGFVIFTLALTVVGIPLFYFWATTQELITVTITVKWDVVLSKLAENAVFAILFTALISWFQIMVELLLKLKLK